VKSEENPVCNVLSNHIAKVCPSKRSVNTRHSASKLYAVLLLISVVCY